MNLKGTTIIITGAARVGQAVALRLLDHGVSNFALTYYKSIDELDDLPKQLEKSATVLTKQVDVSIKDDVEAFIGDVVARFGAIDGLVHLAAPFRETKLGYIEEKDIDFFAHSIYASTLYFAQAVAPRMSDGGSIVIFADRAVIKPYPRYSAYLAAKGANETLTRVLAVELAPKIRVNAILPGPIEPPPDMDKKEIDDIASQTLLNRWGGRDEIAKAVVFLLESDFVTGVSLPVDGGIILS